ncbi:MAG: YcjF family protein [Thermochromatium sp.]
MTKTGRWRRLTEVLLTPRIDDGALQSALVSARERIPVPLIWLIGKTQSGKTSIIRALTGSPVAEVGNGFRPCTRNARIYDFPPEAPVVRFLDTRGLGEVDSDPQEDIRFAEAQSHLMLVVMKAGDLDQQAVLEVVRLVRRRHPEWPLVMVQTTLHEVYPPNFTHPQPYPFATELWPASLPPDLTRVLQCQRALAHDMPGRDPPRWVVVDLTLPEDGYAPADYGLDALWQTVETASALPLRRLLGGDPGVQDLFERAAHPHIVGYALAAAGLGALPVVDLAGVPAIQAKMLQSLATLHGQVWDRRTILEFLGLLGTGVGIVYGMRMAGRTLIKLVPSLGQTLGAVWGASTSGATTFALGKAAAYYLRRRRLGLSTEAHALRRVFADQIDQGARLLGDLR